MRGHIYHMLYKATLREKVRPERLNRGVFHATNDRLFFVTRSEGGCGRIPAQGVAKPISFISLIPLWLFTENRPARAEQEKKAGTRATPPKSGGACDPG